MLIGSWARHIKYTILCLVRRGTPLQVLSSWIKEAQGGARGSMGRLDEKWGQSQGVPGGEGRGGEHFDAVCALKTQ